MVHFHISSNNLTSIIPTIFYTLWIFLYGGNQRDIGYGSIACICNFVFSEITGNGYRTGVLSNLLVSLLVQLLKLYQNPAVITTWISSLFNPLAVPAPHLLSPFLAHQLTVLLKITDRSFRYASPRLWNQLPDSFHQPRQSCLDSPPHSLVSPSLSSSPLSSSITSSLFQSRLKTYLFNKSFPP